MEQFVNACASWMVEHFNAVVRWLVAQGMDQSLASFGLGLGLLILGVVSIVLLWRLMTWPWRGARRARNHKAANLRRSAAVPETSAANAGLGVGPSVGASSLVAAQSVETTGVAIELSADADDAVVEQPVERGSGPSNSDMEAPSTQTSTPVSDPHTDLQAGGDSDSSPAAGAAEEPELDEDTSEYLHRLHDPELRAADEALAAAAGHITGLFGPVDKAEAIAAYERAVAHNPNLSHAWCQLGGLYGQEGRYDASEHAFGKALATAANAGEEGVALWGLGLAAQDRKDRTAAEDFFTRAAKRLEGVEEETETRVKCVKNVASIKYARGDSDAQEALLGARALAAANDLPEIELKCSQELVGLARSRSREDDEVRFLQDALALETRLDRKESQARSHHMLRALAWKRRDKAAQRSHGEAALSLFRELGNQEGIAAELYFLGAMARDDEELDDAYEMFEECLSIAEPLGLTRFVIDSLNKLGDVDYRRDQFDDSERWLKRALSISSEAGDAQAQAIALYTLGCVAEDRGDHREKMANWIKAKECAETAGDRFMVQNIDSLLRG